MLQMLWRWRMKMRKGHKWKFSKRKHCIWRGYKKRKTRSHAIGNRLQIFWNRKKLKLVVDWTCKSSAAKEQHDRETQRHCRILEARDALQNERKKLFDGLARTHLASALIRAREEKVDPENCRNVGSEEDERAVQVTSLVKPTSFEKKMARWQALRWQKEQIGMKKLRDGLKCQLRCGHLRPHVSGLLSLIP